MQRTPISKIFDPTEPLKLGRIEEGHETFRTHHIGIFNRQGKLIAVVGEDDLFDPEGNLFELDE